ncbi:CidA/LrgA family protein [Erysipelothrix tonsillarum]|uniref:CidA/LrgA family protein n=1 Tax=Erysipelothrix tonsillarum TaxID=38402 RepID=UPI00037F862D|nr:CidA/LrgA family protein [Erysipelothrix tonsillarum]
MKSLRGFLVILLSLMLGNLITTLTKLPIPGSIFGMLILFLLLISKLVKLETVSDASSLLISLMMMLFIPGAVNLMNVYEKFSGVIPQLLIIVIVTTLLILTVSSLTADKLISNKEKKGEK